MAKTLYLELIVNGDVYDTIDMYDATEDYDNAYYQALEELNWCNNQEWFEDHYGEDFNEKPYWKLEISLIEY